MTPMTLSRHAVIEWAWGNKDYHYVRQYVQTTRTFDWKEAPAAAKFHARWKAKRRSIIDAGHGSDTYYYVVMREDVKVK